MIHFTADHHFGHNNIIRHCNRPFSSVNHMNLELIDKWNSVVHPGDTVYHLGDFAYTLDVREIDKIVTKLNGKIFLILGNHDKEAMYRSGTTIQVLGHYHRIVIDRQPIILTHYPMRSWHGSNRGSINLHGHCHGNMQPLRNQLDVGVDKCKFRPLSIAEVMDRIQLGNTAHDSLTKKGISG